MLINTVLNPQHLESPNIYVLGDVRAMGGEGRRLYKRAGQAARQLARRNLLRSTQMMTSITANLIEPHVIHTAQQHLPDIAPDIH